jgi:hypothetical protein
MKSAKNRSDLLYWVVHVVFFNSIFYLIQNIGEHMLPFLILVKGNGNAK